MHVTQARALVKESSSCKAAQVVLWFKPSACLVLCHLSCLQLLLTPAAM